VANGFNDFGEGEESHRKEIIETQHIEMINKTKVET
jgi:hypothetical protein